MKDHIFVPLHYFYISKDAETVAAHIISIPTAREDEPRVRVWAHPVIGDYDIWIGVALPVIHDLIHDIEWELLELDGLAAPLRRWNEACDPDTGPQATVRDQEEALL